MFIKTANGKVDTTPKHAFYINAEEGTIKWASTYKESAQRYQFEIPKNLKDDIKLIFDDNEGLSFRQRKAFNLVPHIASKFPDTNNFGIEETEEEFNGAIVFKIVPLKPRVFGTPSEETIAKAQMGLQAYREEKAVSSFERASNYDYLPENQTVESEA